ncbi:hypothetical protein [Desulfamplus magnetovallimortis]|nr:hypothetical protein [Desulfamplus magnetovallimortis]
MVSSKRVCTILVNEGLISRAQAADAIRREPKNKGNYTAAEKRKK